MLTEVMTKNDLATREGSAVKRGAIIRAANELFLRSGVDRVSMDAVSASAGVSKRTVYDYFGDKMGLVAAVRSAATTSLLTAMDAALHRHLGDDVGLSTVEQLEEGLTAFSIELATTIVGSADYATMFALASGRPADPKLVDGTADEEPERLVAKRLAHFATIGLLDVRDARMAADHLSALTLLLLYHDKKLGGIATDADQVRRIVKQGVHAFMRAYGRRS